MNREEKIQIIIQHKNDVDILVHKKYHELAQSYGLSLEQYHLLLELDELMLNVNDSHNAPTIGQMARNINKSQNTVSEKITRLENKGLVKRIKDSSDRRVSRVIITEVGKDLIALIDKEANGKFLFNAVNAMEDSDIDAFLGCLDKLIKQMNAIG